MYVCICSWSYQIRWCALCALIPLVFVPFAGIHWYFNVYVLDDLYALEDDLAFNP